MNLNDFPYINFKDQKEAPYQSFRIKLSQPLDHRRIISNQFNPFLNKYEQLGIKKPDIHNPTTKFLKINLKEEQNAAKAFYNRKKKYIGSRFLESLQDKDYYPIARKSVILHEGHKVKEFKKKSSENLNNTENEQLNSKFSFLYKNFHQIQSILEQCLIIFPNRPNDFVNQFGLNVHTESQDRFLSILYMLNFDVLISSHYLLSNIDTIPLPQELKIDVMKCRTIPILPPDNPLEPSLPKNSTGKFTSDIENVTDILDFNLALSAMRTSQSQVQKFTKNISSRNSNKVLMSSNPSSQGFITLYERDRQNIDSILRADIFTFIGLRIRRKTKQDLSEIQKTEIGWSQQRIPTRRMLLTTNEMFFERRKSMTVSQSRSGSNSSFNSLKSFSSQSSLSTISQSSTTQQSNTTAGSSTAAPAWNREESSNPFTSALFKDQTVSTKSSTIIKKQNTNGNANDDFTEVDKDSDSESSFF